MLRVIFDTNIYGLLLKEQRIEVVRKNILNDPNFLIYGFYPIRKEDIAITTGLFSPHTPQEKFRVRER